MDKTKQLLFTRSLFQKVDSVYLAMSTIYRELRNGCNHRIVRWRKITIFAMVLMAIDQWLLINSYDNLHINDH